MLPAKSFNQKFLIGRMAGFFTLVYMSGLILFAWGFRELASFLSNPARMTFLLIAIAQAFVHSWFVTRIPVQIEYEVSEDNEHWHYNLVEIMAILAAFGDWRNILTWSENSLLRWVGVGFFLAGAVYAIWANWTWISHMQKMEGPAHIDLVLLSEGPFRWARYPVLLTLLLYGLGLSLLFCSWICAFFMIPLIYIIIRRAGIWDDLYSKRYRKFWVLLGHTSKKIIPFLY